MEDVRMTTATGQFVAGPVGTLVVDDGGEGGGPPVVFVHSFGGSTAQWEPQLAHLRRSRRAVALDLRGHGRSDAPHDGDYAIPSLGGDIGAVVDRLGLAKIVLIGHGLGAKAAVEYAGVHSDRVAGLLLAAMPARIPEEQARQMIGSLKGDYERMSASINARLLTGASEAVQRLITRDAERIPRDAGLRIIEASLRHDPQPALERFHGPTLAVITPDADTPNDIQHLVPGVQHEMMDGTSHWMQLDKPDAFNRILDRFLERVDES